MRRNRQGLFVPRWYPESELPDVGPLTADEYQAQVDGLKFFRDNPDVVRIWEFRSQDGDLQGLSHPEGITQIPTTDSWMFCPFVQGRLILHSPRALQAGITTLGIAHSVLFDSNLYDWVVRFVESPDKMDASDRDAVRTLIGFLISRNYDYQLLPYAVESIARASGAQWSEYAFRGLRAILRLHTMNRRHFLLFGDIRPDDSILAEYEREFGTVDLDKIVSAQLEPYNITSHRHPAVDLNWMCLLKMVIIRRATFRTSGLDAQWAAFDDFIFCRLGFYAATLRFIALFYFAGKLDAWIRPQRGSNPERASGALLSCAWDLHLASIPQHILAESPEHEATISHFCTRDRALTSVLSLSLIQMIAVLSGGGFRPYLSIDVDAIRVAIGARGERSLTLADARTRHFLDRRMSGGQKIITPEESAKLLRDVLEEFRSTIG